MLEVLSVLIRLQEVDNKLRDLEEEKGDLPEQLERLSGEIKQLDVNIQDKESEIQAIKEAIAAVNKDLTDAEKRSERSQSVIFNVKTTREYDAVSSELEQAKQVIVEGEVKRLDLMSNLERMQIELEPLYDKHAQISKELETRQKEMQEKLDASFEETKELQDERENLTSKLQKPVLAHYERIQQIRDGVGVSYLTGDACSYCYSVMPPQRQAEVKKMEDMLLCEVCGCILVSEESAPNLVSTI